MPDESQCSCGAAGLIETERGPRCQTCWERELRAMGFVPLDPPDDETRD